MTIILNVVVYAVIVSFRFCDKIANKHATAKQVKTCYKRMVIVQVCLSKC